MPYYTGDAYGFRGDYYRGDYYRGDPGLFSFVGKALGGVAKLGTSIVRAGLGLQAPPQLPQWPGQPPLGLAAPGPMIGPQRGLINIGGAGPQTGLINIGGHNGAGMPVLRGYHLNKTTYETRGGGTSRWPQSLQLHPNGTVLVKNRRRNVGNARALRHALGRVSGFAHLARRVMSFTHPRAGRGHFKFRRKKRAA